MPFKIPKIAQKICWDGAKFLFLQGVMLKRRKVWFRPRDRPFVFSAVFRNVFLPAKRRPSLKLASQTEKTFLRFGGAYRLCNSIMLLFEAQMLWSLFCGNSPDWNYHDPPIKQFSFSFNFLHEKTLFLMKKIFPAIKSLRETSRGRKFPKKKWLCGIFSANSFFIKAKTPWRTGKGLAFGKFHKSSGAASPGETTIFCPVACLYYRGIS